MSGYSELTKDNIITKEGIAELNRVNSSFVNSNYWDDLRVPVSSTNLGGSKDPGYSKLLDNGAGSQGVFTYWFDASTEEEIYFSCQLPHNYIPGSYLRPHVHWVPKSNGSAGQVVSWGLEYTWANLGVVFGNTSILYGNVSTPSETLVANKHYVTKLGQIDGTSKAYSSMLVCRLFRDATGAGATDSYTADAGLLEIDFHYNLNGFGTSEEYSNN
jgi:hypothetical protein